MTSSFRRVSESDPIGPVSTRSSAAQQPSATEQRNPMHPSSARNPLFASFVALGSAALLLCILFATAAQAQGFRNGVQDALGGSLPRNPYAQRSGQRRKSDATRTPQGMVAALERRRDRRQRPRPHAGGGAANRAFRRAARPRRARAARWRSCTSRCSTRSTRSPAAIDSYTGLPPAAPAARRWTPRSRRRRTTRWRAFPSQKAAFDAQLARRPRSDPRRGRQSRAASNSGNARPRRSCACARTTVGRTPSRASASSSSPATAPGNWRQDPVSQQPARARRATGARSRRSCMASSHAVPRAAAARARLASSTRGASTK